MSTLSQYAAYALMFFPVIPVAYAALTATDVIDGWLLARAEEQETDTEVVDRCCCAQNRDQSVADS